MLQSMRQMAHSWFFKALMLLLVVSFGIWGIGDMFRGNPLQRVVAKAGSVSITVQEFNRAFERNLAEARQMIGAELTAQQARQMGMDKNTLDGLIESSLFDQDLQRLGIEAGNDVVFQELVHNPQFQKDGKFDAALFHQLLNQARVSEGDFLNQQRKELASRQLAGALTSVPPASPFIIDALYKARGQKRILDVVTLDNKALQVAAPTDDKILRDYYQQNQQPFMMPEMRGMTIAVLSTDALAEDITVSDDQVKKEYDAKQDQLVESEKRDLLQVIVQDEGQAKTLAAAAKASGNIVSAAEPTGHEVVPLNGADESSLPAEIAKPVFALHQGEVMDPVKTALGWHIIQVRKITPSGVPSYDVIKEKLRASMKRDQAADVATKMVNQLDDELAAGHALDDVADGMKLRLIKIPEIDADGKKPDGAEPAELPHKDDVLKAAFAQNSGETSPVMDDRNGNYYVVRTDSVTPSALKPFEQVKSEVLAAWKKQEQKKLAAEKAETIANSLREGKEASVYAAEDGVDVRASKPISALGDSDPSLPKSALPQIFKLKKGEVAVVPEGNKQFILRLAQIIDAPAAKDEAATGKITGELTNNVPKELADQYLKYLRVLFPVTIHQDTLDGIVPQGG